MLTAEWVFPCEFRRADCILAPALPSLASPNNSYDLLCLNPALPLEPTSPMKPPMITPVQLPSSICPPARTCIHLVSNCVTLSDYLISLSFKSLNQFKFLKGKEIFFFSLKDYDLMLVCHSFIQRCLNMNSSGYWECNSEPESSALRELRVRERK